MPMTEKYVLNQTQLGINVELLLPKKANYQGALYSTLTDGFVKEKVQKYLHDPKRKPRIKEFLSDYVSITDESYEWYSNKIEKIFKGYSVYEVDGVFYDEEKKQTIEEKTQIIRMIFLPPYKEIEGKLGLDRENQQILAVLHQVQLTDLNTFHDKEKETLEYILLNWVKIITFFVYGYVMFRIQESILQLEVKEEEIWVISSTSVIINKSVISPESQADSTADSPDAPADE
jgi:hypothetical protein